MRQILPFYVPMALSWTIMAFEAPAVTVYLTRLPDPDISLAALGLVATLSFCIETPVLGLLSTATALSVNRQHYRLVRTFAYWMMALVTILGAILVIPPIFDACVRTMLGVPDSVADAAHGAMIIMIPWSAGVGFRRYMQGVLIRNGVTKPMGLGTALRLITMLLLGGVLFLTNRFSGAELGAWAWLAGVWVEAIYTHWVAAPIIRRVYSGDDSHTGPTLSLSELVRYHFPLTMANLIWLASRPLFTWGLSRLDQAETKLAGWEAAGQFGFLFRGPAFALPEATIALSARDETGKTLERFSIRIGWFLSLLQFSLSAFGVCAWILAGPLGVPSDTAAIAVTVLIISSPIPLLTCYHGYLKGRLSHLRVTSALTGAVAAFAASITVALLALSHFALLGIVSVTAVLVGATIVETAYLRWRLTISERKISVSANPAREDALAKEGSQPLDRN